MRLGGWNISGDRILRDWYIHAVLYFSLRLKFSLATHSAPINDLPHSPLRAKVVIDWGFTS